MVEKFDLAHEHTSAVVLCGGHGSRMVGLNVPKHLALVGGHPIVVRIVRQLAAAGCHPIVVISRSTSEMLFEGVLGRSATVMPQRGSGTGAAVLTAWHFIQAESVKPSMVWVVPGDMPLLGVSLLASVAAALHAGRFDILMVTKEKPPGLRHVDYVRIDPSKHTLLGFIAEAKASGPVNSGLLLFRYSALEAVMEHMKPGATDESRTSDELRTVDLVRLSLSLGAAVGVYQATDETLLDVNTREALRRAREVCE